MIKTSVELQPNGIRMYPDIGPIVHTLCEYPTTLEVSKDINLDFVERVLYYAPEIDLFSQQ